MALVAVRSGNQEVCKCLGVVEALKTRRGACLLLFDIAHPKDGLPASQPLAVLDENQRRTNTGGCERFCLNGTKKS